MKTYPITTSGTRVLLIDLDNCPKQIDLLHQALAGITRAVACYGGVEPKVQVGLVPLLAAAINEGKLDIIKMEKGRNAADFGLAFWAGRLTAERRRKPSYYSVARRRFGPRGELVAPCWAQGRAHRRQNLKN
jgi:hypothetical protein